MGGEAGFPPPPTCMPAYGGFAVNAPTPTRRSALAQSQVYLGIGDDMSSSVAESIKACLLSKSAVSKYFWGPCMGVY